VSTTEVTRAERVMGVLVGQAAGDALGAGYEFTREPPEPGTAVMRKGVLGFEVGEWTDDTQQAVIVAQAQADPERVACGLLAWLAARPRDVGRQTRIVLGSGCTDPLAVMLRSKAWGEHVASQPRREGMDPGQANGSLMRTGPVALAHLGNRAQLAQAAREVSDVTHFDPTGYTGDACVIWSLVIESAITRPSFDLFSDLCAAVQWVPSAERRVFWLSVINDAMFGPKPTGRNGSAVGAFKVALWAIRHTGSFAGAVDMAVSCGHDTDTTAAIAGQLAGAIYGAGAVPEQWRRQLHGMGGFRCIDLRNLALACAGMDE